MTTAQDFFDAANAEGEGDTQQGGNTYIPKNRQNGPVDFNDPGVGNEGWAQQYGGQGYAIPGYDIRKQGNLIDPWAGLYGGAPGQATNEENRYADMARKARGMQGPQIDYSGSNAGMRLADLDAQRQDAAQRNFMDVVQGRAPSVAVAQQNLALADANAQGQQALAHTRGGGAGLMAAQRQAALGYGGVASQAIGQGAMGRAGEIQGGLGGFAQSATAQRAGSLAANEITNKNAYQQALVQERQNALNADTGLSYEQLRQNVFKDQQQGNEWNEAQNYQAYMQGAGLGLTQGEFNTQENNKYAGAGLAAGGNALTNIENAGSNPNNTTSDIRAKKDIKPGAAQTEAQLDAMHGLALPNGGQHLEYDASQRPAAKEYGYNRETMQLRGKPSLAELRSGIYAMPPGTSQKQLGAAERLYDQRKAELTRAAGEMAALRAPPPPHVAVGPTATGDEIARSVLGSPQAPYYGPTPTGQELAGQILGPGQRPPVATVLGGSPLAPPSASFASGAAQSVGAQVPQVASVPSDENLKTNVRNAPVEQALDHLKPYSYRYKDPSLGEGQRTGIMAQDLEKSPVGLSTVIETPRGKAIDVNRGLSLSLASVADLHSRVKALEAKRGQR